MTVAVFDHAPTRGEVSSRREPDVATTHRPFYFEANGRTLYCNYRPPQRQPTGRAIVVCNAFGKEYEICRTPLGALGAEFQKRGDAVIHFDYGGYGDSFGNFEDATVTTMAEDIEAVIEQLKRLAGVSEVVLLGVRFGATLAALVAGKRRDVRSLVLWEPIVEPWRHFYAALRQSVAQQSALFRAVKATREEIIANVLAGQPTVRDGYDLNFIDEGFPLGREALRELKAFDLLDPRPGIAAKTYVLHIVKQKNGRDTPIVPPKEMTAFVARLQCQATPVEFDSMSEAGLPWTHDEIFVGHAPQLFARTMEWLAK